MKEWQLQKVQTSFSGYELPTYIRGGYLSSTSQVVAIEEGANLHNNEAWVCIDPCPFYAESGGQASDIGKIQVHRVNLMYIYHTIYIYIYIYIYV